jgi:NADH-quinone oxidoreductase subunit D
MLNNFAYVMAVEQIAALQVPERAEYLRVITAELSRIASHLVFVGTFAADLGTFFTPLMYTFRDRERIMDLFELICGARLTVSYHRVGGVAADAPQGWIDSCKAFVDYLPPKIDEYEALLTNNEIVVARTKGVGVLDPQLALDYGVTGPVLRATGLPYDIRRARPYSLYPTLAFEIPSGTAGDCYDRFLIRVREMRQSLRILQQALDRIPKGDFAVPLPRNYRPPEGAAYASVESSRGELGFYVVSDGRIAPYRFFIRAPSFINLGILRHLLLGWKVADAIAILGTMDVVMGEVDR